MFRLLPVLLLASCAAHDQQQPDSVDTQSDQGRIVRQFELPLASSVQSAAGQPARKTFQIKGMQGWLDQTGSWQIMGEVHHGRLRCASYEVGVQYGSSSAACSDVEWLTGVEYATRLRHCNSATRLHIGGGSFPALADRLEAVSCARLIVRCQGIC